MTFYTPAQRELQATFDTQRLADAIEGAIVSEEFDEAHRAFIESRDFFFLSTVNSLGEPTVSHKGGGVGLVKVIDSKTIAFPAYDGNGMFLSLGNIVDTAKIGLLFIDFETPHRVRVQATAKLHQEDPLLPEYPGANAIVRASLDQVFINCARYIHPHSRVETSRYVPDEAGKQPHPAWKRIDDLQGVLPTADQERTQESGGTLTEAEYADVLAKGLS